jgi:hypothetical protein
MVGRETALLSGRRHRNTPARRTEGGFDCSKIPAIRATPVAESRTGTDFSSTILCTSRRAQDARLRIGQPARLALAVSDDAGTPPSEPSRLPSARRCKCATPARRALSFAWDRPRARGARPPCVTCWSSRPIRHGPLGGHRRQSRVGAAGVAARRSQVERWFPSVLARRLSCPPAYGRRLARRRVSRYCAAVNASCGSRTVAMSFRVAAGLMS